MLDLKSQLVRALPKDLKGWIKGAIWQCQATAVNLLLSYSADDLKQQLRAMGIKPGDSVVTHVGFSQLNGFKGGPVDLIDCLVDLLGPQGHLFMVSMPYGGSSRDYLAEGKPFNVKRTPSQMGFVTEAFRRRPGVVRSENPLHPVLALGPRSEWMIAGHGELSHTCGKNSPFEKMLELNTKALFFDVSYITLTFTHYLEDKYSDTSPVPVYTPEPMQAQVICADKTIKNVQVYPFSADAVRKRDFASLYAIAEKNGYLTEDRIGNTTLQTMLLHDLLNAGQELIDSGKHLYDPTALAPRITPYHGNLFKRSCNATLTEIGSGRIARDLKRLLKRIFTG